MTISDVSNRLLTAAVGEIGDCLRNLSIVLQQGASDDNMSQRANIARGLERAAAYIMGKRYDPVVDQQHAERGKAGS